MKLIACAGCVIDQRVNKRRRTLWPAGLVALSMMLGGCQTAPRHLTVLQRSYRPDNIFAYPPKLSINLQRVAVLPLAAKNADHDLPEGCEALGPVLWEQLVRTKRFEVVAVDAAELKSTTGQAAWTGAEALPADFLSRLRREYGCDAVLFAELTAYRAYAPMAVGWRLKLVDVRSGQMLWAADELFDEKRPDVAVGAQKFVDPRPQWRFCREENWLALNSPSQLGRYSAATLLDTLPTR